ncbi:MAG TPA: DNA replication/repair protein RecF [bacterium]|nr:DNA replication/repair protein RecF [bacterium]HOC88820.1 DNA replication/repair protein RecF [bacterium]
MFLRSLAIESFRNLDAQHLEFYARKNYLFGENAQGKTNLLEAIYLLCLCKSFRTSNDAELIPLGKDHFNLTGRFADKIGIDHEIVLRYHVASGKQVILDGKPVHHLSSLVGQFPVVVLSAADYDITHGSPQQRRRFFNILASQCSSRFLNDLKEYEKVIKQRNRILWLTQNGRINSGDELEAWNEQLILKGCALMEFRSKLVSEMAAVLLHHYRSISGDATEPFTITYEPNVEAAPGTDPRDRFVEKLRKMKGLEIARGVSMVGPHRDEFKLCVGERTLRQYGSRGEHKSALISIKAAELFLLKSYLNTTPMLLLDDLYAELDQERGEKVIELFSDGGQCIISGTSADFSSLQHSLHRQKEEYLFFVREGRIERGENGS